jgi:hypothetical protein
LFFFLQIAERGDAENSLVLSYFRPHQKKKKFDTVFYPAPEMFYS